MYNVQSGYFNGVSAVQNAITQIKKNTGVRGSYQKAGKKNNYTVAMSGLTAKRYKVFKLSLKEKMALRRIACQKTASVSVYRITAERLPAQRQIKRRRFSASGM